MEYSDLTIEEIDLIGSHLDKEIEIVLKLENRP